MEGLFVGLAMGKNGRFSRVGDGNPATGGSIFDGGLEEAAKSVWLRGKRVAPRCGNHAIRQGRHRF